MKRKDAARILEQMEFSILVTLMERIKEKSSAAILAVMNDQVARKLTAELVRRKELKPPA
jgi:flagellar motility protein MotE (MotC chaperone)